MRHLNYKHLHHFWLTAKEGGVGRASEALHLTPQTISAQIGALEAAVGELLFDRTGRRLELTHTGKIAFQYAEKIFGLGAELVVTLNSKVQGGPVKLAVGIADALPKAIACRILEPAYRLDGAAEITCHEGELGGLLELLASHRLDLILADKPVDPSGELRFCNRLLGESGISFFAKRTESHRYRPGFPLSLNGAPMLVPTRHSALRQSLDRWFEERHLAPSIAGEFEDAALMQHFGQAGIGIFAAPFAIEEDVQRQYEVEKIGETSEVKQAFYAVVPERSIENRAVVEIVKTAKQGLLTNDTYRGAQSPPTLLGSAMEAGRLSFRLRN
jgi:LysR family transcriptional activator of nhaA